MTFFSRRGELRRHFVPRTEAERRQDFGDQRQQGRVHRPRHPVEVRLKSSTAGKTV